MITTKNISMYVQELKTKILDEASSVCMTLWYYINIKQVLTWWSCLKLIKEKFEVANDYKLTNPAFFDTTRLGNFYIALVSSSNASRRINTQGPFSWK